MVLIYDECKKNTAQHSFIRNDLQTDHHPNNYCISIELQFKREPYELEDYFIVDETLQSNVLGIC